MRFLAGVTIFAAVGLGFTTVQGGTDPKPKPLVRGPIVAISPMVDYDEEYYKQAEIDAYLAAVEAERIEHERQVAEYVEGVLRAQAEELARAQRSSQRTQVASIPSSSVGVYYEGGTNAHLQSIKQCESGGNYAANTGNGFYGAYQFTQSTWYGVGGTGNPADASPQEQDMRAQMLYNSAGPGQWPVCQYR